MHQEEITDATHRSLTASLFSHTRALLEKKNRTQEDDINMVHCTHASRYHWSIVGTPLNFARGERIEKDEDRNWLHKNLDDIQTSIDG